MKKIKLVLVTLLLSLCFSCTSKLTEKHLAYHIINDNETIENSSLYKIDNNYIFRGEVENNYLKINGIEYRIIQIFENGSIEIISDDNSINKDLLSQTIQYSDEIVDINNITYKNEEKTDITYLDVTTYLNTIINDKTYLYSEKSYWLLNTNGEKGYVAYDNGLALDDLDKTNDYRYVVTLKSGISYLTGKGTIDNPYIIDETSEIKELGNRVSYTKLIDKKDIELKDLVKISKASMIMTGDALIHGAVYKAYETKTGYDFTDAFEYIKPIVQNYDIKYYNQETILGGSELGVSTYPQFNSPIEVGEAFLDAGFNLVSLATNHTLDCHWRFGNQGLENEIAFFSEHPEVYTAGVHLSNEEREKIEIAEVNGITYGFLSCTYGTNGITRPSGQDYLVDLWDEELAKNDIEKYRDKCDLLIVAMHWGEEYNQGTTKTQREQAQFLADLGVDIIIGCHPHVLEPIEMIDDTLCIYSLGNFISAQIGVERLTGALVSIDIIKTETNGQVDISFENVEAQLIYTSFSKNFKVIPYSELNNNILNNYEQYAKEFTKVLTKYWDGVSVK